MKPRRLAVFFNRPGRACTGRRGFTNHSSPSSPLLRTLALALAFAALLALTASSAAAAEACPNEALRAENNSAALPDCRAYEQATPPAQPTTAASFPPAMTAPGTGLLPPHNSTATTSIKEQR